MALTTPHSLYKLIQSLLERIEHTEKSLSQGISLSKEQQEVLSKKPYIELLLRQLRGHGLHSSNFNMEAVSLLISQVFAGKGSMNENMDVEKVGKGRYLCVSDGFSICCLDLKQRKGRMRGGCSEFVHPKTSNLKLLEEGFPLLMGMFKVGSHAYMVGGQEFPGFKDHGLSDLKTVNSFLEKYSAKGGSFSKTYKLSQTDGVVQLSQADNIKPLNKPQFWAVVEKAGDQVLVIGSDRLSRLGMGREFPLFVEVLNVRDPGRGWIESPSCAISIFARHLVVGKRMYAWDDYTEEAVVVFDSGAGIHQQLVFPRGIRNLFHIRHVAELLKFGFGGCIGEYVRGDSGDSLYVVLGIGRDPAVSMLSAAVYLVTEAGQVLCFQRERIILAGFDVADLKERLCYSVEGIVASSDGEQGTTMCSIIQGSENKSLLITTFTWEAVDGAFSLASNLQAQQRRDGCHFDDWPGTYEVDFLRVVVKGYYVAPSSATGLMPRRLMFKIPTRLSACFL